MFSGSENVSGVVFCRSAASWACWSGFVRFHVQHERDENRLWSSSPDGLRDNGELIKRVSRILLGLVVDGRTNSFKCKRTSTDKELEGERMMCGPAHKINLNCLQ